MKKRFLALFTAAATALSATAAYADENFAWEANVSSTHVEVGDTFNFDLDITENPGVQNATIYILYDPDVVKPVSTVEPADDIITYHDDNIDMDVPFFSANFINSMVEDNKSNGMLIVTNYTTTMDKTGALVETEGAGTLFRVSFQAVGEGDAGLTVSGRSDIHRTPKRNTGNMAYAIDVPSVTVGDNSNSSSEENTNKTTAEPATETATKAPAASSSNSDDDDDNDNTSSGRRGGGGSNVKTTAATTTTESTTSKEEPSTEATTASAPAVQSRFTDLGTHPWAEPYINELADKGIINGYSDNTFKPGANVKRADFVIMLMKAMGVDTNTAPKSNFSDIRDDKYYYNAVGLAKDMGVASGNPDGTFDPESNITRQDMMILAKKALEIANNEELKGDSAVLEKFADKGDISAYAADSLAAMVQAEIVSGTGNNIEPKANTTRAQAAVIICKMLDKINQ